MHKNTNALVKAIRFATLAAVAAPATVMAGGFSLNEQSASQMGVANAGAAANPENATTVLFNPAGMSQLSGTNISFGAAVLDIDAEAKSSTVQSTDALGQPGAYKGNGGDIADPAVLPNFYLTHEINDSIDVGFGIHAPYGLAADYENDFAGRYLADKTELTVISFSPSIAVNNGKGLSMGVGINVMYGEGRLTKYQDLRGAVVRGSVQAAGAASLDQLPAAAQQQILAQANGLAAQYPDTYSDVEGDDIAINFRVGFLYELSEATQFGLTAQTGTEFELEGDLEISQFPGELLGIPGVTGPQTLTEKAEVPLAIPESLTVGVRHQLNPEFTLLAGATYSRWSRFEELDVYSAEGGAGQVSQVIQPAAGDPITHVTEKWNNTWQFNLGGIWQANEAWAFKAGYAFDESPVNENFVTARIPSEDRHWLTLGTQWKDAQSGWTIDAAIGTLIFADDANVDDREYSHQQPTVPSSGTNYQAEYDLSAWSAAIEFSKAF
ncbi:OmpP1/FadL family transporter [Marinobacter vinifirmus]|uniref:Aromatic hydrocarbon degradation protein n=1 Tax=Marinobacter vinifirmus TaxID=355591 RepID=A0A558BCN4_9GAMM|nr:outer membrane protein transport protein [Marinobacter vinifirmus]TVT34267.1 MAG: aromatic hydrocarbon degradation protein [Marinobacter vinifirmus]